MLASGFEIQTELPSAFHSRSACISVRRSSGVRTLSVPEEALTVDVRCNVDVAAALTWPSPWPMLWYNII